MTRGALVIVQDFARLLGGGVLLYFGAEWLVRGAAGLAARLRVRPLVIGLTVVAYGTSAPELVVGVNAAFAGRGGIAFGNAVGSNLANLGLILGLTCVLSPPVVDASLRRRELPVLVLTALALPLLLIDGRLGRLEGAALVFLAVLYTALTIRTSRAPSSELGAKAAEVAEEARLSTNAPVTDSAQKLGVIAGVGLGVVLLGGTWFVDGASGLAHAFGVSERVVGLTIVAVGTSVPELATSIIAARRGHADLAVGNVLGSNIFNVLLVLGVAGLAGPIEVSLHDTRVEIAGLLVLTAVATVMLGRARRLSRVDGSVLLALYTLFLIALALASAP